MTMSACLYVVYGLRRTSDNNTPHNDAQYPSGLFTGNWYYRTAYLRHASNIRVINGVRQVLRIQRSTPVLVF